MFNASINKHRIKLVGVYACVIENKERYLTLLGHLAQSTASELRAYIEYICTNTTSDFHPIVRAHSTSRITFPCHKHAHGYNPV